MPSYITFLLAFWRSAFLEGTFKPFLKVPMKGLSCFMKLMKGLS